MSVHDCQASNPVRKWLAPIGGGLMLVLFFAGVATSGATPGGGSAPEGLWEEANVLTRSTPARWEVRLPDGRTRSVALEVDDYGRGHVEGSCVSLADRYSRAGYCIAGDGSHGLSRRTLDFGSDQSDLSPTEDRFSLELHLTMVPASGRPEPSAILVPVAGSAAAITVEAPAGVSFERRAG